MRQGEKNGLRVFCAIFNGPVWLALSLKRLYSAISENQLLQKMIKRNNLSSHANVAEKHVNEHQIASS